VSEGPAGGDHDWTDDVGERYSNRRTIFYIPPRDCRHCDQCGMSMPPARDDKP
jgi:hypothetical protein